MELKSELPLRQQEILSTCLLLGLKIERRISSNDPGGATRLFEASSTLGSRIVIRNPDSDGMVRSLHRFAKREHKLYEIENKTKAP